jgi:hypothetical protein
VDLNPLLLQALTASSSGGGLSAKDLLLSQLDESDPTTTLLINLLAQQKTEASTDESASELEPDFDRLQAAERAKARAEERAKALRHLRHTIDAMYAELEELRARNDALAAAVGACYLCWGEDSECPVCGGKGQAGFFAPERPLFAQIVVPAVHRYKQETATPHSPANTRAHVLPNQQAQ